MWFHTGLLRATASHLSIALLTILFATNVYRASTQSITVDEAASYNHFIANPNDPFVKIAPYNDNLNTLLSKLSVRAGLSEFTLRLPSVLGGLVYFIALFHLCRLLFGDSPYLFLAVAANSLNPFLLDYLSAARGYGMGIAFWTVGAYYLARWVIGRDSRQLLIAGVALGLAMASHATEIFAVTALEGAFVAVFLTERWTARDWRGAVWIVGLCVVTLAVAAVFLWTPLNQARGGFVEDVVDRYRDSLKSIVKSFLFYKSTPLTSWMNYRGVLGRLSWLTLPALMVGMAAAATQIVLRWTRARRLADPLLLLFSLAVPLTFLLLSIEPKFLHHGYFAQRRLLSTLPVIFIACPLWLRWLSGQGTPQRMVARAGVAMLTLLTVCFALQFNVKSYSGWEQDAGTRRAMQIVRDRRPSEAGNVVRLGAGPFLNEGLNFYRRMYAMDWMEEVTTDSPECRYDYYYLLADGLDTIRRFGVEELFRDETAKTVLAQLGPEARRREAVLREYGFTGLPDCAADLMADEPWVKSAGSGAERHFLRGFMPGSDNRWRWTFNKPVMLFHVRKGENTRFVMNFVISPRTFPQTGSQTLTVLVNGKPIGARRYVSVGEQTFDQPVPADLLREDGIALVQTDLDRYYISPDDQQKLGYLFVRGGFVQ